MGIDRLGDDPPTLPKEVLPKWVLPCDLDETLRGKGNKTLLKRSHEKGWIGWRHFLPVMLYLVGRKAGLMSFEDFAERVQEQYGLILKGRNKDYAQELYREVNSMESLEYAGAVDLLRRFTNQGVKIALLTGTHDEFVRDWAAGHGIRRDDVMIFGSEYERNEQGLYTGFLKISHVTADQKRAVLESGLTQRLSESGEADGAEAPVVRLGYLGNEMTDRCGYEKGDGRLRAVAQQDKDLWRCLEQHGFYVCDTVQDYLERPEVAVLYVGEGENVSYTALTDDVLARIFHSSTSTGFEYTT